MVNKVAIRYYKSFSKRYLHIARTYVRKYDELTKLVAKEVISSKPLSALDIGVGVGNIERMIFKKNKKVYITCLDIEQNMINITKENLKKYLANLDILKRDIMAYKFSKSFDVIFSNMTLHNLPIINKKKLLKKIFKNLNKDGEFIWGDLISFKDKSKEKVAFEARKRFAISNGHNPKSKFFINNFYKEEFLDHQITSEETVSLLKNIGFRKIKQIWEYDNFGLFIARK